MFLAAHLIIPIPSAGLRARLLTKTKAPAISGAVQMTQTLAALAARGQNLAELLTAHAAGAKNDIARSLALPLLPIQRQFAAASICTFLARPHPEQRSQFWL